MIKRPILLLTMLFGASVFCLSPMQGQERQYSIEELTSRAEIVAVGTVASRNAEWSADQKRIWTHVLVSVTEQLKGSPADELLIRTPGGEVGEVGEIYSHAARFTDNEEVVVFLNRDARGVLRVTGGEQGKLTVGRSAATGVKLVDERTPFEALKARIRHAVQRQE
jgi:hypothetical protein